VKTIVCAFALILGSCTVGAPRGFSAGDHWTFPLVGPLEDGLLITPVRVHGHGPYLFAIDPDASVTAIEDAVAQEAGLRSGIGPKRIDETNTGQNRFYAEVIDLEIAGLAIERRDAMVFPAGFYDAEGRHISGIIGRDVLADSLVFGFDRDHGIATLSTVKAFTPPPGAIAVAYETLSFPSVSDKEIPPPPRRIASSRIGGATFTMHLDLGATVSQLREAGWSKAGLAAGDITAAGGELRIVDEAATVRRVASIGRAPSVVLGAATSHASFVPYVERRFPVPADGALGLDFFQPYAVYANWDTSTYLLKPRGDAAATTVARLGRWGAALPACASPGCVSTELAASGEGAALRVVRDAAAANRDLELLLAVAPAGGKPVRRLVVALPRAVDRVIGLLSADYLGAAVTVLDASPFPRSCSDGGGCIIPLEPEAPTRLAGALPSAAAAPVEAAPMTVPLDKLHRRTGEPAILPSAAVRGGGKPVGAAIIRLCLSAGGTVESVKVVKSSNVPAYDDEIQAAIKTTWTFEPVEIAGKPVPVCTQVTFIGH
jgi:TonB family protein